MTIKVGLNGHAVRVPLANASLTDCVFEVERATTVEEVNRFLKEASENELKDILGFEERPLVSIDYRTDPRSSIIDALSTVVINGTQVKLYAWYDNEWGYANRTGSYWAFTLTDGALRMLVVLHFHALGYSPLQIAALFLFYELFGVITNLLGGYLGARLGLNRTMNIGLGIQVAALLMLTVPVAWLNIPWVMGAQALSGIAKDLNKMSAKSSIKLLVPDGQQGKLYQWVAILTGSKNALKGVGFFLGGALLALLGFKGALLVMAGVLALIWIGSLILLSKDLGKAKAKPRFRDILSKSRAINILSAARMFLLGARDVWFVVALPVYLSSVFGWDFWEVGGFLAAWVIGYGIVQSVAPGITGKKRGHVPDVPRTRDARQ